ncbi:MULTISPECIES: hypothetical protein [Gammaproteobacteria]|uniref:hypothetical protein n=1 Tax=Gammaproteobacteria TaxID=1236 RepID=UPI002FC789BA
MAFGVSTWDESGLYNNYGIKPVTVVGIIDLAAGQKNGTYYFTIEPGLKVGFAVGTNEHVGTVSYTDKRNITSSGNSITISPSSGDGINDYPATKVQLIIFAENA